jgi:hypothetical protein
MQWVNVIFYIVPNVNVLVNPCEGVNRLVGKTPCRLPSPLMISFARYVQHMLSIVSPSSRCKPEDAIYSLGKRLRHSYRLSSP